MPHATAQAPAVVVHAPAAEPPLPTGAGELPRQLGGWSALAVLLGAIIGSGIFRVPRIVAASTGSVTAVLLCWVIGGLVTLCGVLTVAELATMFPRAGGMYVYVREAYGRLPAFLLGWTDLMAVPAAGGAIALLFATYLGAFVPLGDGAIRGVAAGLVVLLAVVNYRSMRLAARLQAIGTPAKVLALVLLAGSLFAFGHGGGAFTQAPTQMPARAAGSLGGFGVALIAVFFSYDGWAQFSAVAGEVREPGRTLPRVLVGGILLVLAVYLLVNVAYLYVLPLEDMAASKMVAADALHRAVGPAAGSIVAALVMLSTFSALNSNLMALSRIFFAMSRDGVFFPTLAVVHPAYHTPHRAVLFSAGMALLFVFSRTFEQLAETHVIALWPFFTLAVAGVFVLRRRRPDHPRPYRTLGYPVTPIVLVVAGVLLVVNALVQHPASTLGTIGFSLLGWPMYRVWERRRARSARAQHRSH